MCKYSFLLPAYKVSFFEEALGSILGQTYTDFNVIVSDDCSPEDLKSVVDKFNDSRVSYRRNEKNIGAEHLVDHWNQLLDMTDAEYIIMASDDDVYDSRYLEEMDRLVNLYSEINVFRPRLRLIHGDGKEFWREKVLDECEVIDRKKIISLIVTEKFVSGIPQFVFKRQALVDMGGFVYFPFAWFSDDATVEFLSANGLALSTQILFSFRYSGLSISTRRIVSDNEWKGKLFSTAEYMKRVLDWQDVIEDKDLLAKIYKKGRKNTIVLLDQASIQDFLRIMKFIKKLKSPLYPFSWRVKRYIGRFYHKVTSILKISNGKSK